MKIEVINNNLNFQKQLRAECAVLGADNKSKSCNIYKLEPEKDQRYFSGLSKTSEWKNSRFMDYAIFHLPRKEENISNTYVLENKRGECLGFCEITKAEDDYVEVIETCPKYRSEGDRNKESEYKYIGETLLAFLAKQAKTDSVKKISLTSAEESKEFYRKAGFQIKAGQAMRLYDKNFDSLIENNEKHTGSKINLAI